MSGLIEAQFEPGSNDTVLKNKLGITVPNEAHAELVIIHPFREGNGRCARILASIMALQAGLPILDFSIISGSQKSDYYSAVQIGLDRDYEPMEKLFTEIIENSIRSSS